MAKAIDQIVKLIDRRMSNMPIEATIVRIDGSLVDITLGPGSGVIRNVTTSGSTDSLEVGQKVAIIWAERAGGYLAPVVNTGSGASYISSSGADPVDHTHPSELVGAGFSVENGIIGTDIAFMSSGQLRVGRTPNILILDGDDPSYKMWAGAELPASALFKVGLDGRLHAARALLTAIDQPFQSIPEAPAANTARMFVNQDGHLCVIDPSGAVTDFTMLAGGVTDHGQLYGLTDDDHPQYVHKSTDQTITAQHTINPTTPKAPFVLGANAQNQLVTGLNAEKLDGHNSSYFAQANHPHSYLDMPRINYPFGRSEHHRLYFDNGGQLWNISQFDNTLRIDTIQGPIALSAGAAGGNSLTTFDSYAPMGYIGWMPASGTSAMYWSIASPRNWNGRQLMARMYFTITESSLQHVRWKFSLGRIYDGAALGAEHYYEYATTGVPTKNYVKAYDFYYIPAITVTDNLCGLSVRIARAGSDVSDTCPYPVGVLMVLIQPMDM